MYSVGFCWYIQIRYPLRIKHWIYSLRIAAECKRILRAEYVILVVESENEQ